MTSPYASTEVGLESDSNRQLSGQKTNALPMCQRPGLHCDIFDIHILLLGMGTAITSTYRGKVYTLLTAGRNWSDSAQACVDLGGHLVVVEDNDENTFITNMIK